MNALKVAILFWVCVSPALYGDGFRLKIALEMEPHLRVHLTPEQVIEVGRTRCLKLTDEQRKRLGLNLKNLPAVLGVESLGEPDCSCCIGPVMWTPEDEVTIWLNHYSSEKDNSEYYRTVRMRDRHFVMDSEGRIFQKGVEVPVDRFRQIANTGEHGVHLAMPPDWSKVMKGWLSELWKNGRISIGL